MTQTSENYERLKKLMRDKEFREVAELLIVIEARIDAEERCD